MSTNSLSPFQIQCPILFRNVDLNLCHNRNLNSFLASQEFPNQHIEDNDKIPSARIPINFDEFGKPLEELKRSESNDLVPEIVVDIIQNIKHLSKFETVLLPQQAERNKILPFVEMTRPHFTIEDEPSEGILLEFLRRLPQPLIPIEVSRVLIKIQESEFQ